MFYRLDFRTIPATLHPMKKLKTILFAIFVSAIFITASGCSTVKGVGEDFEAMGRSIQNAGD